MQNKFWQLRYLPLFEQDLLDTVDYITDVIHYMYQHLDQNLTLEEISLKMKEACFLLRSTDKYIYEIARELGYSDQYYFSRIFKRLWGCPPDNTGTAITSSSEVQ